MGARSSRKHRLPFLTVIGNHDCLGNGEDTFNYIFGPQNFSLNIGHTHFVGLNTVALEYDYSHPVPDLDFIEADATGVAELNKAEPGRITHTVVVMHSRPYDEQFNNNVAKAFNLYLTATPDACASTATTTALIFPTYSTTASSTISARISRNAPFSSSQ